MEEPPGEELADLPLSLPPPPEADAIPGPSGCELVAGGTPRASSGLPPPLCVGEDGEEIDLKPDGTADTGGGTTPDSMDRSGEERTFTSPLQEGEEGGDPQCEPTEVGAAAGDLMREGSFVPSPSDGEDKKEAATDLERMDDSDKEKAEVEELSLQSPPKEDGDFQCEPPEVVATVGDLMPQCSSVPSPSDGEDTELDANALLTEQMDHFDEDNQLLLPSQMEVEEASVHEFEEDCRDTGDNHMVPHDSLPASPSSSSEEDEKTTLSEPHAASTMAPVDEFEQEEEYEDAGHMMPQASPPVSPSSLSGEDEKTAVSEPDTAGTADVSGGYDAMEEEAMEVDVEEAELTGGPLRRGSRRRKRGRPPKAQVARTPKKRKDKEEEEVCFICFDGGDLVVCDRRGCPKVYHPSCVDRDEAFFRAKGRWNCGWHICSNCQKSAHYMCFTCTHSLCKVCFKEAVFFCVRGSKGFCQTCMSTVMMIETKDGNENMVGVDFDDKNSFEYLFKDYWLDLKAKLSLTQEELLRAKNQLKGSEQVPPHEESSDDFRYGKEEIGVGSDNFSSHQEESTSSRSKGRKRSRNTVNKEIGVKEDQTAGTSMSEEINWASDELLEFVAHMKNGDRSALSQFDVQALLLEYIKRNNLRDPRKKSQIICDSRLENLFGKSRVGHFEMLKLLESHFLLKEASPLETEDNQGGVEDPDPQMDADGNSDASGKLISDKRKKSRKKGDEREQANLDDYAAIDVHNISLMYLRRNLMEELINDIDTFDEKVVGSFVRIRISGASQRQDVYRLVQVVGTGRAAEKYKSGKKFTDVTLEILNLDKKEVITIDIISNQEFTEEECKRLRQSIRCGLISPLTVGEVQDKARALQTVKVNDWLESEKLRLGHLRDRASEKGRRKELRECVEKLQLLSTPEERRRRLNEVPEIHTDPHMDPDYESPEEEEPDIKRKDFRSRSRGTSFVRNMREVRSAEKGGSMSSDKWSSQDNSNIWESNRNMLVEGSRISENSASKVEHELTLNQGTDAPKAAHSGTPKDQPNVIGSRASLLADKQHMVQPGEPSPAASANQSASASTVVTVTSNPSESEKVWHYKDPSAKIQGPFSMVQLRKWSTNGFFPTNLRIWRVSENQDDSILLTDALIGNFQKDLPQWEPPIKNTAQPGNVLPTVESRENNVEYAGTGSNAADLTDNKQNEESWRLGRHEKWATQPSALSSPNAWSVQMHQNSPGPVAQLNTNPVVKTSNQGGESYDSHGPNWNSPRHQSSSNPWNGQAANDSSNKWRNKSSNLCTPTLQASGQGFSGALDQTPSASAQAMTYGWRPNPSSEERQSSSATTEFKQIQENMSVSNLPLRDEMNQPSNVAALIGSGSMNMGSDWKGQQASIGVLSSEYAQSAPHAVVGASGSFACVHPEGSTLQSTIVSVEAPQLSGDPGAAVTNSFDSKALGSDPAMRLEASSGLMSQLSNPATEAMGAGNISFHSHALPLTNSGWNNSANPTSSNNKNIQLLPSVPTTPMPSSQFGANITLLPGQLLHAGLVNGAHENSGFVAASQNLNTSLVPAQGNTNVSMAPAPQGMQGDTNVSWATQGNTNMPWGQTAQSNASVNMGFTVPQVNMMMNPGWVAPVQGNTNMNVAWVTPPQLNTNQVGGWGPQMQGNMALNPGWGMLTNPFPGWVANMGNTNQNWGNPPQGNMSNNALESGQGGVNQNWAPSAGNGKGWNNQQEQSGDRHPGRSDTSGSNEHRQSARKQTMQPGKLNQPPSGGHGGICRFHEAGHCKKGASCNYFHS